MSIKLKCPHCENLVEYLEYSQPVTEYGRAYIEEVNNIDDDLSISENDINDTQSNDDCDYSCPECSHGLDLEDLIRVKEEEENKECENEEEEKEEKFKPIKTSKEGRVDRLLQDITICPKCKYMFPKERNVYEQTIMIEGKFQSTSKDQEDTECPNCQHVFKRLEAFNKLITNKK